MSLRIESERVLAPKLLSAVGKPKAKAPKFSHILFPFAGKYRSPKRVKWWDSDRLAFPHHTHQKVWVPPRCLSFAFLCVQGPAAQSAARVSQDTIKAENIERKRQQSLKAHSAAAANKGGMSSASPLDDSNNNSALLAAAKYVRTEVVTPFQDALAAANRDAKKHQIAVRGRLPSASFFSEKTSDLLLADENSIGKSKASIFRIVKVGPFLYRHPFLAREGNVKDQEAGVSSLEANSEQKQIHSAFAESLVLAECLHALPRKGVGYLVKRRFAEQRSQNKDAKKQFRTKCLGKGDRLDYRGNSVKYNSDGSSSSKSESPVSNHPSIAHESPLEKLEEESPTRRASHPQQYQHHRAMMAFTPRTVSFRAFTFKAMIKGHLVAFPSHAPPILPRSTTNPADYNKSHWELLGTPLNGSRWFYPPSFSLDGFETN